MAEAPPADSLREGEEYQRFRSLVPLKQVSVAGDEEDRSWVYYDLGPREKIPLICLPGASGTANNFYRQMIQLCPKGYRIIATSFPPYRQLWEFVQGLEGFMQAMNIDRCHLMGVSLGGFLAQVFASVRPELVASLVLVNTFCDATPFHDSAPCREMLRLLPAFMLKRTMLKSFPQGLLYAELASAVDFMVEELETLKQKDVAARLYLNTSAHRVDPVRIDQHKITIIESLDDNVIPAYMKEDLREMYPDAKYAPMKHGGAFPFLAAADEFSMMLEVHLRNQELGLECGVPVNERSATDESEGGESSGLHTVSADGTGTASHNSSSSVPPPSVAASAAAPPPAAAPPRASKAPIQVSAMPGSQRYETRTTTLMPDEGLLTAQHPERRQVAAAAAYAGSGAAGR